MAFIANVSRVAIFELVSNSIVETAPDFSIMTDIPTEVLSSKSNSGEICQFCSILVITILAQLLILRYLIFSLTRPLFLNPVTVWPFSASIWSDFILSISGIDRSKATELIASGF